MRHERYTSLILSVSNFLCFWFSAFLIFCVLWFSLWFSLCPRLCIGVSLSLCYNLCLSQSICVSDFQPFWCFVFLIFCVSDFPRFPSVETTLLHSLKTNPAGRGSSGSRRSTATAFLVVCNLSVFGSRKRKVFNYRTKLYKRRAALGGTLALVFIIHCSVYYTHRLGPVTPGSLCSESEKTAFAPAEHR